jgi:hypothetical protein
MKRTNWWAVLVAVLAQQALGALWYSRALFLEVWMAGVDKRPEDFVPAAGPFILGFLAAVVLATGTAWVLQQTGKTGIKHGMFVGLGIGIAFTVPPVLVHEAFLGHPDAILAIDGAKELVCAVLVGAILGAWPKKAA